VPHLLRSLRRYWVRFRCAEAPRFAAVRAGDAWEADFASLADWRSALDALQPPAAQVLDAGERDGALEEYFVRMVS
jgi:hypothetical protein